MIRVDTERFFPAGAVRYSFAIFRTSYQARRKGEAEWLRQYAKCGWKNRNSNPSYDGLVVGVRHRQCDLMWIRTFVLRRLFCSCFSR